MKKKISFKTWISVFFGGIRQFFRNIFSWKNKTLFWRFVGGCLALLAIFTCCEIGLSIYRDIRWEHSMVEQQYISNRFQFVRPAYSSGPGWISCRMGDKKVIDNVDWVVMPLGKDSLAVFSQNGKRGYINRYTGHVPIPAKYDAAWLFSKDMAAVADGDSICFINTSGKQVINKRFKRDYSLDYVFHGDYCVMNNSNNGMLLGLIDRKGNWAIEPKYDEVLPGARNYWQMREGDEETGLWYAFTDKIEPVNMEGVRSLSISEDLGVIYTLPNHLNMVIDFDGNRQEKFFCQDIEAMYYNTEKHDTAGSFIEARTTLYRYTMPDGYEGLCRADGDLVTEPLYWTISPIGKDLYHCTYRGTSSGVIINSNGEITKQKI